MASRNNIPDVYKTAKLQNWFSTLTDEQQRQWEASWEQQQQQQQQQQTGAKRARFDVPLPDPVPELTFTTMVNEKVGTQDYVPASRNAELAENVLVKQFPGTQNVGPVFAIPGNIPEKNGAMINPTHLTIPSNMPELTRESTRKVLMKGKKTVDDQLRLNEKTLMEQNVGMGNARKNLNGHVFTVEASSKALESTTENESIVGLCNDKYSTKDMDNYIDLQENKTSRLDLAKEMQLTRNHMLYCEQKRHEDHTKLHNDLSSQIKGYIEQASVVTTTTVKNMSDDIEKCRGECKGLEQKFSAFAQQIMNNVAIYGNMVKEGRDEYLNMARQIELLIQEVNMKKLMLGDK